MTKFEVGKSYALHLPAKYDGKATFITDIYTVTKRTPCYLTFSHISHDGTKMPHCRCKIFTSDSRGEFVHATAFFCLYADSYIDDDSQPDEIATAEITNASDNDNALASQPANAATVQSDTNDNAKSLLDADYFKGKSIDEIKRAFSGASLVQLKGFALCYTIPYFSRMNKSKLIDALASKISLILEERNGYMTAENVTGDNGYAQQDDIIIPAPKPRTIPQPVSVKFIPGTVYYGNDSGNHYPVKIIARTADAVTTDFIGAWIKEAKIQTIAGVEYAAFMTQYRNIEIWADKQEPSGKPQSEDTAQPEISAPAEITQPDALYMDDSYSDAPGDNSCPDMDIPEIHTPDAIPTDNNPLHHLKPCPNCRSTHIPFLKRCDDNNFSTATRRFNGGIARQHIYYRLKCRDCGHEVTATVYRTGLGRVIPHQNEADVKNEVFQAWNKQYTENPGFTIVPSEHIERPQYTTYPDTITDECPYVTVPACDIPENHSHAAVVPYNQASGIRCFLRLIAIYIRLWLASNITPDNDTIRSFVFAPWLVELEKFAPGNPNDFSPLIYKWRRKDFSEKLKLCRSQIATCKTREEIIAALQGISSESIRLLCVADRVFDKFTRIAAPECERKLAYARRYADKIIQRREKAMTIKAEVKDITAQQPHVKLKKKYTVNPSPRIKVRPEAAPADIEHKLIETKDLHFAERRKALDHNAAVISSCMFLEAVISLLSSISPQAIIQLGFYLRLFIAKPKGKKNVIAELFAKRLIECRELHANVRSNPANINAKYSASVPEGVKFFETKHRQLGFIFTE